MRKASVLLSALLCLFLSTPIAGAAPATSGGSLADGVNAFACDLYGQLRTHKGNLFFSPLGITYALAAAGAGARGETAAQMERTLRLASGGEQARRALADLLQRLNVSQDEGHPRIEIANSLWPHKDFSLRPEYVELAQKYFDTAVLPVDYQGGATEAAARINAWIEEKTRGRIRDIMSPPPADTRLVLANAVYFRGVWASPFDPGATREDIFHAPGKAVQAPFMKQTGSFGYLEARDLQILERRYAGGAFSLLAFLPAKTPGALEKLEKDLGAQRLAQWTGALIQREVQVVLPKFKLSWGPASLTATLGALGMQSAFSPQGADFGGMSPDPDLFIDNIVHQADVDLDEQGTAASAATMTMMAASGRPGVPMVPPVFRADRPFVFLIRENAGGTVLFMGRLTNPR
ncbi:MAG: serpin family protein [Deltaproteobacteria bacterium]|jgi:serpin B|nr:serpin family protein [Deltaproteobacteria bacterium]